MATNLYEKAETQARATAIILFISYPDCPSTQRPVSRTSRPVPSTQYLALSAQHPVPRTPRRAPRSLSEQPPYAEKRSSRRARTLAAVVRSTQKTSQTKRTTGFNLSSSHSRLVVDIQSWPLQNLTVAESASNAKLEWSSNRLLIYARDVDVGAFQSWRSWPNCRRI